jgi:hypothetical protein
MMGGLEGDCAAVSKCALVEKQKSAATILGVASKFLNWINVRHSTSQKHF